MITPVYSFNDVSFKVSHLFKNQKLQFLHLKSFDGVDYDIDFLWEERWYFNQMSWVNEATALNWNFYTSGGATIFAEFMLNTYNSSLYTNNRIPFYNSDLGEKIWRNSISEFDNSIDNFKSTVSLEKSIQKKDYFRSVFSIKTPQLLLVQVNFGRMIPSLRTKYLQEIEAW